MSRTDSNHDALFDLLAALCDGTLDEAGRAEMQRRIVKDPDAAALYVEYMHLHASVPQHLNLHLAAPSLPAPSRATPKRSAHRKPIMYALAAAVVLIVCSVVMVQLSPVPVSEVTEPAGSPFVSIIDSTGNLFVNNDAGYAGGTFGAATYELKSGTAEFLLAGRVLVNLQGETRLALHDPMNATLSRGVATFECPPEARGFTVKLPDGSHIVDLGTKFQVRVDAAGDASVRVIEGVVNCQGVDQSWNQSLSKGHAVWFRHQAQAIQAHVVDLPDNSSIGRLEVGLARVDRYLDAHITGAPPMLIGLPAVVPQRGAGSGHPGAGYQFMLTKPARLYLLVHDRGTTSLDGWERTSASSSWIVMDRSFTDTIYTRLAQPGVVNIPEHTGIDPQGLHGVPNVCMIAPPSEQASLSAAHSTTASESSAKGDIE